MLSKIHWNVIHIKMDVRTVVLGMFIIYCHNLISMCISQLQNPLLSQTLICEISLSVASTYWSLALFRPVGLLARKTFRIICLSNLSILSVLVPDEGYSSNVPVRTKFDIYVLLY